MIAKDIVLRILIVVNEHDTNCCSEDCRHFDRLPEDDCYSQCKLTERYISYDKNGNPKRVQKCLEEGCVVHPGEDLQKSIILGTNG